MRKAGIYCITNTTNKKCYIGSSVNIKQRFREHRSALKKGMHENILLQNSWNKNGEESFRFYVLDYVEDIEELVTCEQQWLDSLRPVFNIRKVADSNRGLKGYERTPEIRKKTSLANKGKRSGLGSVRSPESRIRMSQAQTGRIHSQVTKDKISKARTSANCSKGHEWTPENTIFQTGGGRACRTCRNTSRREKRRKQP